MAFVVCCLVMCVLCGLFCYGSCFLSFVVACWLVLLLAFAGRSRRCCWLFAVCCCLLRVVVGSLLFVGGVVCCLLIAACRVLFAACYSLCV